MSFGKMYQRLLQNHFYLVQCIQTASLMTTGDCLAQLAIEKRTFKQYDFRRTAEFAFLGGVLVGPAVSAWYILLQRQFGHERNLRTTLCKMCCDQLLFAPMFLVVFITSLELIHDSKPGHIKQAFKNTYMDILLTNWKVWPAVQMVNFYVIPLQYQVLFVQAVAVFWNTYLSWKTQN
ncbi:hypothetical protein GWI33_021336 [Rhynchophorus ferrugineus]|uniref:Mitochondrial inner membrane protein Mpv17 n=1 Tax=Rhynchophorus ferrugineus TaxID=354439 RepID=A0A834I1H3_RHYFE|nr:hypothetical protein GWI33_021336 [Rhynchophorus ferrugineus]